MNIFCTQKILLTDVGLSQEGGADGESPGMDESWFAEGSDEPGKSGFPVPGSVSGPVPAASASIPAEVVLNMPMDPKNPLWTEEMAEQKKKARTVLFPPKKIPCLSFYFYQ